MEKRIGIIGAGLGGLSAAIRLANSGFSVNVYEQNLQPGGKANQINENGFRFDTGPTLLTMPFIIEELFDESNERLENFLDIIQLKKLCKYFYSDGTVINAYSDLDKFSKEISLKTGDAKESVLRYLKYSEKIYELTADLFLFNDFSDKKTFINSKALKTLMQIWKIDPFRTMHKANKSFFNDERTIQLFDRYATYNGSNPYKAPATLNIIQHVEYNLGGYVVKGGIYSIVNALYKLALKKGVNFFFGTRATQIITEGKKVKYLIVNKNGILEKYNYENILSNADVNFTYKYLLKDECSNSAKRYAKLEPSTSALVFYWGIKGEHNQLEVHNILFSKNYKEEFVELFENNKCPDDPTIYIYISSKYNRGDSPDGFENWFVMVNAPHIINQNWQKENERLKKIIIDKIKKILNIDLQEKIVFEKSLNPEDLEKITSSYKGSLYGISSNGKRAAFLRQKNHSKEYSGLYFCGGSSHPGGGIPLVILSGKLAAKKILEEKGK
jgi:phytoene desaturase